MLHCIQGIFLHIKPYWTAFYQPVPKVPKFQPRGFGTFFSLKVSPFNVECANILVASLRLRKRELLAKFQKISFPVSAKFRNFYTARVPLFERAWKTLSNFAGPQKKIFRKKILKRALWGTIYSIKQEFLTLPIMVSSKNQNSKAIVSIT